MPPSDEIIRQIMAFQQQIRDTDTKVRQYLADRKKYPHPRQEELIQEIRRFEPKADLFLRAHRSTEVEMRLDGLLHSLVINEKVWKRQFEQAAHIDPAVMQAPNPVANHKPVESASNAPLATGKLFDRLYAVSKKKWDQHGIAAPESKEQLAARLVPEYNKLRPQLQEGKKLSVVFDKKLQKVRLRVDDSD